jgi:hypothetical protein
LAANIDVRAVAVAAPELCARLSKSTGVPLRANDSLKEDLVVLYAPHRPASEVLRKLAKHFHWEWVKAADGYELRPTADYPEFERRKLREEKLAWVIPFREEARAALTRYNALAPAKAVSDAFKALTAEDELEKQAAARNQGSDFLMRTFATRNKLTLTDPVSRFAALAQASLTDEQLLELAQHPLVFSTAPKPLQLPFAGAVRLAASAIGPQIEQMRLATAKLPAKFAAQFPVGDLYLDTRSIANVRLVMAEPGAYWVDILDAAGRLVLFHAGTNLIDESFDDPNNEEQREIAERNRSRYVGPALGATALDQPLPPSPGLESAAQQARALIRASSTTGGTRLLTRQGVGVEPLTALARYPVELAVAANVCLVSDCYDSQLGGMEPWERPKTARRALDQWARNIGSTWSFEDGWVTLRSSRWASSRAAHAPREVAYEAMALYRRQWGITFEQQAAFASRLSPAQFESPLWRLVAWPPQIADSGMIERAWAAIDRGQRDQLRAGRAFALSQLAVSARSKFVSWLSSSGVRTSSPDFGMTVGSSPNSILGEPEFTEDPLPRRAIAGPWEDLEVTELTPGEILSGTIEVRYVELPVICTFDDEELRLPRGTWGPSMLASSTIAPTGQLRGESAENLGGVSRFMTQDIYRIRIRLPGRPPITAFADGLRDLGPADFHVTKWPAELRRRVETHWAKKDR